MKCKFCNAELENEQEICSACGKEQPVDTFVDCDSADVVQETTEDVSVKEITAQKTNPEVSAEEAVAMQPKAKKWPFVVAIVSSVVALCALAVLLLVALGVDFKWLLPRANDIFYRDVYNVSDKKAIAKANDVVATVNGKTLTNTQLQIYYNMQIRDYLSYYGEYATYFGLNLNKPLSEQTCYHDETMTWEQYFLKGAMDTWYDYQVMAILAEESGHVLGESWTELLKQLPKDLEEQAKEEKYESVDAFLQDVIGPGCTLENYMETVKLVYLSYDYYNTSSEKLTPSKEEIEAYFTEHEAVFNEQGITKESGLISSVRHILIEPEGGKKDEQSGKVTYSDDEWTACYAKAEKLLNEWKSGEATEKSFSDLVADNTADTGSASTGGLYENIYKGSGMTETFEAWAIDKARKTGDTGIVKTEFGYHIMYFVSGEEHWIDAARTQLLSERITEVVDEAQEKWPMNINYRKIVLAEFKIA